MTNQPHPGDIADVFDLSPARMHEAEGAGRRVFGIWQAQRHAGELFWIIPMFRQDLPLIWGLPSGVVTRLHLLKVRSETDLLWSVEEVLRATPAGLVIAEPEKPLSLTAGRRLQLAAKAGQTSALMLIHEGAGSNASETRWHCRPRPSDQGGAWHEWRKLKDKKGATGDWLVAWDGIGDKIDVLDGSRQRRTG